MDPQMPEWAAVLRTPQRVERFENLILRDFERRGMRVAIEDGQVTPMQPRSGQLWGLSNLAQTCAAAEPRAWPAIITGHFDRILAAGAERAEFALEEALERLVIRLWDERDFPKITDPVAREDIPGLRSVLCLDLETSLRNVTRQDIARWDVEEAELWVQAVANTVNRGEVQVESLEGTALRVVSGDPFYTSSLLLALDRFEGEYGRFGAFVSAPTRQVLCLVPFDDAGALAGVNDLLKITIGAYRDGPGSTSPRIYWYRGGELAEIPYTIDERGQVNVTPPAELVEVLVEAAGGSE